MEQAQNKHKILIFSLAYAPFIGGAEIAVQEITKRLAGDFEFEMITCNLDGKQKNEEQIDGVKIYRVGKGWIGKHLFHLLAYKKAVELYQKNNYSTIWSIMANRAGFAALKFKEKFPKVKYLLTLQEGDPISHIYRRTWFWFWRYKKIYQKADRVQVISRWLEKRARIFGYKGVVNLVSNGVVSTEIKRKLRIPENEKIILTVSRLVEKNGIEDLIKAFKILINREKKFRYKLIIVGDGPLHKKLEKLSNKLGVSERILFIGKVPYEEVNDYYQMADIFIRPSLTEGFGNVFLEAMAYGVPVIATPVGGIVDFLVEEQTGWRCQINNPHTIVEKIIHISDKKNEAEIQRVVGEAMRMVKEKYTWEKVAEQMKEIFNELIK